MIIEQHQEKVMVTEQKQEMQTVQQIMAAHNISIDRLALVAGIESARVYLLLRGNYIRKRHAEYVLRALSILSGKQWTCANVAGLRIYQEYPMPFVPPYQMFHERKS